MVHYYLELTYIYFQATKGHLAILFFLAILI